MCGETTVLATVDAGDASVAGGHDVMVVCGVFGLVGRRVVTEHTVVNVVGHCGEVGGCEGIDIKARESATSLAENQQFAIV